MIAFDCPITVLQKFDFETRYEYLLDNISTSNFPMIVAGRMKLKSGQELEKRIKEIVREGGEGLILQRPLSFYENGRSSNVLKFKAVFGDKEALVVKVQSQGVKLKLPSGIEFNVPWEDMHVTRALRTGDVVSFSYDKNIRKKKDNDFFENDLEEDNKEADNKNIWKEEGAPSVPKIFRIRSDLLWEDVQREAKKDVDLEEYSHGAINGATPQRHWTSKKGKNLRIFLEGLASKMGMDPLLPDTWYKIPRKTLKKYKAGKAVLKLGGYITALLSLFPDIGLDVNKFTESIRLRKPFQDVQKRRDWFCNFAREKGFEPLQPNGWYSIPLEHLNTDSVKSILSYYSGDAVNALLSLFPEIGFDKSKFFYANKENRRVFFETLAYDNGFDPKNAKKWESISLKWKKFKSQGVQTIVNYYDGSLANALADVFPDIGIEPARFTGKYWGDIANQRKFFESFATINNFDPLVPDNWYKITGRRIKKEGGKGIVANYAGESASLALLASFPEIGLKKSKFIRHAKSIY